MNRSPFVLPAHPPMVFHIINGGVQDTGDTKKGISGEGKRSPAGHVSLPSREKMTYPNL